MASTSEAGPACPCPPSGSGSGGKVLRAGAAGAVISGFLASACCIGPLLAVFLGVSSAGALLALEPFRPLFAALMFGFLGFGFYRMCWRPRAAVRRWELCCTPRALRTQRVVLWIVTVLAVTLLFVPSLLILIVE